MAKILVIDDQETVLKMLASILTQHKHVVTTARDGHDGIEKAKNLPFQLVISDAIMPGGVSGFDVVKTLRANDLTKNVPIILLTGRREKKDVERAIAVGVDDYVVKPVEPDLLIGKVEALLRRKSAASVPETPISELAAATVDVRLVGISEAGMTLEAPYAMPTSSSLTLTSDFFRKLGLDAPPLLRVAGAEYISGEVTLFRVHVEFVALPEKSAKAIASWIRGRAQSQAS